MTLIKEYKTMKGLYIVLLLGILSISAGGCYRDKSRLQSEAIPEILVEFEGLEKEIHIDGEDVLSIRPQITAPPSARLSYKWELSQKAGDYEKDMEVISTDKELMSYLVTRPTHATTPYYLRYTIKNESFGGVEYIYQWKLYVSPVLADGLLFAYTKDGMTSDLGYIKSSEFTRNYQSEKKIIVTSLCERRMGKPLTSLVKSLHFSVRGNVYFRHIPYAWVVTQDHKLLRFDPLNYTLDGSSDNTDIMMVEEEHPKILQFSHASSNIFMRTEKSAYLCLATAPNFFSAPIEGWEAEDISGDVVAAHGCLSDRAGLVWYNGTQGCFKALSKNTITTFDKSDSFDPNQITDGVPLSAITTIEGPRKEPGKTYFLLQDKTTQRYSIYEFNLNPSQALSAVRKYEINGECKAILDRRTSIAIAARQPILYVATEEGVHIISWNGDGSTSLHSAGFLSFSQWGKVKMIRLYRQGEWLIQPHRALFKLSAYNEAALIVITEGKGGDDQVHFVPMTTDHTASLGYLRGGSDIRTFSPKSGKILDIISIGK